MREAKFYLQTCGLKRLDGDGDGIPCNALCR
ncbi:MAG: excalibur calcium-binding domain-containing protein [Hyphomicrobiaceae bacterium]